MQEKDEAGLIIADGVYGARRRRLMTGDERGGAAAEPERVQARQQRGETGGEDQNREDDDHGNRTHRKAIPELPKHDEPEANRRSGGNEAEGGYPLAPNNR